MTPPPGNAPSSLSSRPPSAGSCRADACLHLAATCFGGLASMSWFYSLSSLQPDLALITGAFGLVAAFVSSLTVSRPLARRLSLPDSTTPLPALISAAGVLPVFAAISMTSFSRFRTLPPGACHPDAAPALGHLLAAWGARP